MQRPSGRIDQLARFVSVAPRSAYMAIRGRPLRWLPAHPLATRSVVATEAGDGEGAFDSGGTDVECEVFRVHGLEMALDEPESALRARALEVAGLSEGELRGFRLARRSIDARRRRRGRTLRYVVQVELVVARGAGGEVFGRALRSGRVRPAPAPGVLHAAPDPTLSGARVAVVGTGPAGLFAAWTLARSGVSVDLIDRGPPLRERGRSVARFVRTREPEPESNLLYGEGGAGTYSDGKLYTRVDHELEQPILEELIACGAPAEIAFDADAHIGTDKLHRVLPRLRARLEAEGARFHWRTRLEGWVTSGDRIRALRTNRGELACDAVVLALGHSARDTLEALMDIGLQVVAKPFQLGVRIEHPQSLVTAARYGVGPEALRLGAAPYRLVRRASHGLPAAYSFCMCPGGQIVPSVSEPGLLCTNGMSNSLHSSSWANAAVVVTLGPDDFGPEPLDGVRFQQRMERIFFEAGGSDYTAPAQRADDFLAERDTARVGRSSYKLGVQPGRIDQLLPPRIRDALTAALRDFDRKIPGFAGPQGLLVGIESRSSGPVRLPRDPVHRRAPSHRNLYPVGEGAGYAGGIMSAAIDGARSALALLRDGLL